MDNADNKVIEREVKGAADFATANAGDLIDSAAERRDFLLWHHALRAHALALRLHDLFLGLPAPREGETRL